MCCDNHRERECVYSLIDSGKVCSLKEWADSILWFINFLVCSPPLSWSLALHNIYDGDDDDEYMCVLNHFELIHQNFHPTKRLRWRPTSFSKQPDMNSWMTNKIKTTTSTTSTTTSRIQKALYIKFHIFIHTIWSHFIKSRSLSHSLSPFWFACVGVVLYCIVYLNLMCVFV